MELRRIWQTIRSIVPVSMYPLLAPVYRWDRRRAIRRLERDDAAFRRLYPDVVVPGAELRFNVVGATDAAGFLTGGRQTADGIETALAQAGATIDGVRRALDFGCGCGRLLLEAVRRWPHIRWTGCDVDERGVDWCAEHLAGARVVVNPELPPLPFAEAEFDLIWCGSVFTHLDEERQDAWLAELCRTLVPGGYLLASLHGPACWTGLPRRMVRQIEDRGFVFARTGGDEGIHPEWYQVAWHTRAYIDCHWSKYVAIRSYVPRGFGVQDVVVAQKAGCQNARTSISGLVPVSELAPVPAP